MVKTTEGKHASDPKVEASAGDIGSGGMRPVFSMDQAKKKDGKSAKALGITLGVVAAVLLVVYLAGAVVFMGRFFPHTQIAGIDISLKTPEEVHSLLDEAVGDYSVQITGQGMNATLSSQEMGMALDSEAIAEGMMGDVNPWAWPVELFSDHDETGSLVATYSSTDLADALAPLVEKVNESAVRPVDATIAYDEASNIYEIVPETYGTTLNAEKVAQEVAAATAFLKPKVSLTDDVLVLPSILEDDERLATALAEANEMIKADLQIMMEGNLVTEVTPSLISSWMTVSPEATVSFDDAALSSWLAEVSAGCDTVGSTRTYTRPDGKEVTVSGGTYGWEIDSAALQSAVTEAVKAGTVGTIEVPVLQSGNGFSELGSKDWGNSYVDIDLSEQHARFYDDAGALVWETDVVTGTPGEHATPEGVYSFTWGRASPSTLIGEMQPETGKPEYETEVAYWMPFIGNSIGLHDATWQSAFGGSRYKEGYGSHGCVNISLDAAAQLWGLVEIGDVVVVHW